MQGILDLQRMPVEKDETAFAFSQSSCVFSSCNVIFTSTCV